MLLRNGAPFTIGVARFEDEERALRGAKIVVKIEPEAFGGIILAVLDTGAPWSMLDAEVAEALSLLDGDGQPVRMSTRIGEVDGRLERTRISLVADRGESLSIDATVWVSREWQVGTFLGYGGLLERVRFAIDPSDNSFHFGRL